MIVNCENLTIASYYLQKDLKINENNLKVVNLNYLWILFFKSVTPDY